MNKAPNDPFDGLILDTEEAAIERALEKGDYESVPNFTETKKMVQEAATHYTELNSTKPVTIRLKQTDLIKIKAKAKRSNIPYQTLLSAAIHDFAEGRTELRIR